MSRIPVVPTNVIIMRKLSYILSLVFTVTLFVPSFAIGEGEERDDLLIREGLRYKRVFGSVTGTTDS